HTAHYTASNILRHSTFILVVRLPTNSTLFPYTPLFRSRKLWADVFPSARSLVAVGKFARYEARSACSRHCSSIDFIRDTTQRALSVYNSGTYSPCSRDASWHRSTKSKARDRIRRTRKLPSQSAATSRDQNSGPNRTRSGDSFSPFQNAASSRLTRAASPLKARTVLGKAEHFPSSKRPATISRMNR